MATATVAEPANQSFTSWFWEFLKGELSPYPGRWVMVARIVIAATITMMITMTFKVPGGAVGALYAFVMSRENLTSTAKSAFALGAALLLATLFVPIGAPMFASDPMTHFFWESFSILLIFFLLRTLTNYSVASAMGLIGTSVLGIWYLPGPAEKNLEQTLWQILSPGIGAAVTIAVEAVFHAFQKEDQITIGLTARLQAIEDLLNCYAADKPIPRELETRLAQFATIGLGTLRRLLARSRNTDLYRVKMSAVISLTGRSLDYAAAMTHTQPYVPPADRPIAGELAREIGTIRQFLKTGQAPPAFEVETKPYKVSILRELEGMIALIPQVIEGSTSLEAFHSLAHEPEPEPGILVPDAFSNPEHLRFALSGCLAGTLCYIIYISLAWPGLSTSVTTCVLTALSTIGSSRQKQVLRIAGAMIGGFGFGLGAQVFILPNIDSITGFTLLFVAVSSFAAWVSTSSSRLSYGGLQIALAFYLIHLNDFTIQTSLTIARDRTLGVLLGISMMWLVFERLQPTSATDQMIKTFNQNLGLLAELEDFSVRTPDAAAITTARRLRDKIYNNFSAVNAQSDAVPFELGALRNQHMAARDRIRRWQAALRTAYLLQLALVQYHVFGSTEKLSAEAEAMLREFEQSCAQTLKDMAAYLEAQRTKADAAASLSIHGPVFHLTSAADGTPGLLPGSFLSLAHELLKILDRLREQILAEPLFAPE